MAVARNVQLIVLRLTYRNVSRKMRSTSGGVGQASAGNGVMPTVEEEMITVRSGTQSQPRFYMVDQKDGDSRIVRSQASKSGESESLNKLRSQPEKSRRREVQRQAGSVTRNQDKGRIHRNKEHGRAEDLPAVFFVSVPSLYRTFGTSSRTGCTYTWRDTHPCRILAEVPGLCIGIRAPWFWMAP